MALLLLVLGAIGHMVLWIALINRVHALGIKRRSVNLWTLFFLAMLAFAPVVVGVALALNSHSDSNFSSIFAVAAWIYVVVCAVIGVTAGVRRWYLSRQHKRATPLLATTTEHSDIRHKTDSMTAQGLPSLLSRLPGNQLLNIHIHEKELAIPRLSAAHAGLRIAHLTDLHISGRLTQAFFEHVVEVVNAAEPDIVAITGDIVEGDQFLNWLPPTLGRLKPRDGVYYILGNHDRRATEAKLKTVLADAGLIHVGNNWRQIDVSGVPLVIAGNELPWYKPAADFSNCVCGVEPNWPVRILLSHSPDQFEWAQENNVDLMMAGHLHGGQFCLPYLGAIASPSLHGVRYASGVFRAGDTVMHVSRGVGALTPLRINCPPEIAILNLRPAN